MTLRGSARKSEREDMAKRYRWGLEMDAVLTLLLTDVEGLARRRVEADQVIDRTGITDQQWWQQVGPSFVQVFDTTRFPLDDQFQGVGVSDLR
jgi:hypothetical protein